MKKFILFLILCVGVFGIVSMTNNVYCAEGAEVIEENKSALAMWIEEQFSSILAGLIGCGGATALLSVFLKFLKKNSNKLIEVGVKYGKSHEEMEALTNKISDANDKLMDVTADTTARIADCVSKVEDIEKTIKDKLFNNDAQMLAILEILKLMSLNNKELVENGTASEIAKQLNELVQGMKEDENSNEGSNQD